MKYCRFCLNTDTRPNTKFSAKGLCPPCEYAEDAREPDWDSRKKELSEVVNFGRANNASGYDCIVGVSGGKDSTRQAFQIRDQFGLKPLLVSMSYPPEQISQRGVDNLANLVSHGFDCVSISCGPESWRQAMRHAFFNYGNWAKPTELALFASVPRVAVAYQIPLIWWGESAALMLGDLGVLGQNAFDGNRLKYSNTLKGGDLNWLLGSGFDNKNLIQYQYPTDEEMAKAKLRIVFMDYFMKDFSLTSNGNFAALRGLVIRKPNPLIEPDYTGTSQLDEDFFNINMYIRYLKFGFGRASDLANFEIRAKRLSRSDGIRLVEAYDGNYDPTVLDKFCKYLDITKKAFWEVVDRFVDYRLFKKEGDGIFRPKFTVGIGL
jgi:N-acetyl sugar amidotransferase